MEILAISGIKPGAFWLQDAFCNLLAAFTDSILAPRWRGSCFRRPWQRKVRRCGWTSAMCLFKWTRPVTALFSSSLWPSTTSLMIAALSEPGQQKVYCDSRSKMFSRTNIKMVYVFWVFTAYVVCVISCFAPICYASSGSRTNVRLKKQTTLCPAVHLHLHYVCSFSWCRNREIAVLWVSHNEVLQKLMLAWNLGAKGSSRPQACVGEKGISLHFCQDVQRVLVTEATLRNEKIFFSKVWYPSWNGFFIWNQTCISQE